MLMTLDELRQLIDTDLSDEVLTLKLNAAETAIRKYTNNNFQNRKVRTTSSIVDGVMTAPSPYFKAGDTVEITQSELNGGLYVIQEDGVSLSPVPYDCDENLITKVEYPPDVKAGVASMLSWDEEYRDKVGVASETLSRHSVSYFNMDDGNSSIGYPKALVGFLRPYMKARFD